MAVKGNGVSTAQNDVLTGFHELKGGQLALTLAGLMLGIFLSSLDQTIVSTALPSVIASLNGLDRYAWVFTSYMVTSTAGVLVFGKLSDMYGRKWIYIAGVLLFLLGSALSGMSQTMNQLIAFRAFQGIGAGVMMSVSFAIVGDIFPPAKRGKWMGLFSGIFALSSVIGPTVGGYITDNWSWRWVFYVNLPLGAVALAFLVAFMPRVRARGRELPIDYLGVALLLLAVVPMLVGVSLTGLDYGWRSPQVVALLAFSAVALVAFLLVERRAKDPILPLAFFRDRTYSASAVSVFLTSVGMFGAILFIPLFVQGVIGKTATGSGNVLMPLMLGVVAGAALSGQLISRTGRFRAIGVVGIAVAAYGMYLLSRMQVDTGMGVTIRNMVVLGLGLGTTMPLFTIVVQNAFPQRVLGQVTSSVQFFRGVGGAIGSAVFGSIFVGRFHDALLARLPERAAAAVTSGDLSMLNNPESLSTPQAQAALQGQLAQLGLDPSSMQQLFAGVKASIVVAFQEVFVLGLALVAVAWLAAFFLKEIPLRKSNVPEGEGAQAAEQASQPGAGGSSN